MTIRVGRVAVAFLGLSLLSACAGIREHRGFVLDDQLAQSVQVGVDNKESVAKSLGRPTFVGQFSDNDWYYVSQDTRQLAFGTPKVADSIILHVQFDAAGNVVAVNKGDESKIAAVSPMAGKTPTLGHKKSLIQELFGNIGSISQPGMPGSRPQ